MIKRIFIASFIVILSAGLAYAINVSAQTASNSLETIQFPIASLGNCANKQECKKYCDDPSHAEACLTFAQQNGLMSKSEVERAKSFEALVAAGKTPGGCDSKDACQAYCHDQSHAAECIQFAQNNGLISKTQADTAQTILKNGGPGGCTSKDACEQYCNDPSHAQECLDFAQQHGLIKSGDAGNISEDVARLQSKLNGDNNNQLGQCLHQALGANGLDKVQSGALVPDTTALSKVQDCFSQFGKQAGQDAKDAVSNAPTVVKTCLQQHLGSASFQNIQNGQPPRLEDAPDIRQCMERDGQGEQNDHQQPRPSVNGSNLPPPPMMRTSSESDRHGEDRPLPPPRPSFNPFPTNEPSPRQDNSGPESFLGPQGLVGAVAHFFSR